MSDDSDPESPGFGYTDLELIRKLTVLLELHGSVLRNEISVAMIEWERKTANRYCDAVHAKLRRIKEMEAAGAFDVSEEDEEMDEFEREQLQKFIEHGFPPARSADEQPSDDESDE